jgi:diguanylate cyclase (GGDEF)-like protein
VLVAERLRTLVEVAGSPGLEQGDNTTDGVRSTVSCGVASTSPGGGADVQSLLDEADKALYRAKAKGRNSVCGTDTEE